MSKPFRLLEYFSPESYELTIDIANSYETFSGYVKIEGKVAKRTNELYFHFSEAAIDKALVCGKPAEVSYDTKQQTITLKLDNYLTENLAINVEFEFSGKLSQTMEGMYRSDYKENSEKKTIVSTQFESTHAREVFPCIDEPAAKATFDLTLITPVVKTVLANTKVKTQTAENERLETVFETSPKMSSYLLAWVVGDLAKKHSKTSSGTEVAVFATHSSATQLDFSLDVGVKVLDFFEEYFGIKYPLAKLDMVAIPEFASGAMENWGLVTYRETAMLYDKEHSSLPTKRRVIEVIAHELAHQWFGNLVTMQWWDDLWLNESFATFMSFLCAESLYPDLGFSELFMEEEYFPALHADSNSKTTSIYAPLEDPKDINEHFDPAITYGKGAAVLRMLHNFIGDKAFKAGLHKYLKNKQYANAVGKDLWDALKQSSGKPIDDYMMKWVNQAGYPLITYENGTVRQSRYYEHESSKQDADTTWPVKLGPSHELNEKTMKVNIQDKINPGQFGFYRTKYTDKKLHELTEKISSNWDNTDLMGLLDDTTSLTKAGECSTESLLDLIASYRNITSDSVWDIVFSSFGSITSVFRNDELKPKLDKYGQELVSIQYERLGWTQPENESPFDTLLRPTVLAIAAKHNLPDAIKNIEILYKKNITANENINPNLRTIVYATSARTGNDETFNQLLEKHDSATSAEEKRRFASALCSFESTEQIERAIELIKSDHVRKQEVISWIFGLYQNRHARSRIWQWQKDNWEWIYANFGRGHLYSYFVMGVGSFNDESDIKEVKAFFNGKDLTGIKRTLEQSIEKVQVKSDWKKRDLDNVHRYLFNL